MRTRPETRCGVCKPVRKRTVPPQWASFATILRLAVVTVLLVCAARQGVHVQPVTIVRMP